MSEILEFKFDTQLLIEGHDLDEDEIFDYITEHFEGDCLLAVGDDELIKIHFHTNQPWEVLEYCAIELTALAQTYRVGLGPIPWLSVRALIARAA